jgi:hypothetical protein
MREVASNMVEKAKFLGKSGDITCELCFLIKSQNPKIKYHLISEGSFYRPDDKYICEHCLNWIREVRKAAEEQCQHPEEDKFKDLTFWHDPKREEKSAIEVKDSATLKTA